MRSNSSNNSCRRRLARGANASFSNYVRPFSLNSFFLPAIARVHRQRLQLIHDSHAHLPTGAGATTVAADPDSPDSVPRCEESYLTASVSAGVGRPQVGLLLFYSLGRDYRGVAIHTS